MDSIYLIHARTGCTCCSGENHYRGPYRTHDDAARRKAYYLDAKSSEYPPVASQYARRGVYDIVEVRVEGLPDDRVILNGERVFPKLTFIEVQPDGSAEGNEEFCKHLYPD